MAAHARCKICLGREHVPSQCVTCRTLGRTQFYAMTKYFNDWRATGIPPKPTPKSKSKPVDLNTAVPKPADTHSSFTTSKVKEDTIITLDQQLPSPKAPSTSDFNQSSGLSKLLSIGKILQKSAPTATPQTEVESSQDLLRALGMLWRPLGTCWGVILLHILLNHSYQGSLYSLIL